MPSGILLDTHVFMWWSGDEPGVLGPASSELLDEADVAIYVSAVTPWEMQIKRRKIGARLLDPIQLQHLTYAGFLELPVSSHDGLVAGALPLHHKDPFDRMLVAQCINHDLMLMSSDRDMHRYDIEVFPAGL